MEKKLKLLSSGQIQRIFVDSLHKRIKLGFTLLQWIKSRLKFYPISPKIIVCLKQEISYTFAKYCYLKPRIFSVQGYLKSSLKVILL